MFKDLLRSIEYWSSRTGAAINMTVGFNSENAVYARTLTSKNAAAYALTEGFAVASNDFGIWFAGCKDLQLATLTVVPSVYPDWRNDDLPGMPAEMPKDAVCKRLNKDYMQAFGSQELYQYFQQSSSTQLPVSSRFMFDKVQLQDGLLVVAEDAFICGQSARLENLWRPAQLQFRDYMKQKVAPQDSEGAPGPTQVSTDCPESPMEYDPASDTEAHETVGIQNLSVHSKNNDDDDRFSGLELGKEGGFAEMHKGILGFFAGLLKMLSIADTSITMEQYPMVSDNWNTLHPSLPFEFAAQLQYLRDLTENLPASTASGTQASVCWDLVVTPKFLDKVLQQDNDLTCWRSSSESFGGYINTGATQGETNIGAGKRKVAVIVTKSWADLSDEEATERPSDMEVSTAGGDPLILPEGQKRKRKPRKHFEL
ncbi:hypothetical protein RhiLY_12671 [Ceratobasidium sp. AG-Ba]|nr:hypothetical protein RhiLY_12671 [Ceratobasidium sp. AG-Ba]